MNILFSIVSLLLLPNVLALSFNVAKDISLKLSPLVGGPTWLPVHVKVFFCDDHGFDFVPLNPISVDTLEKLLTLQAVPAEARILPSRYSSTSEPYVLRAQEFCSQYTKKLHLINNNCWSFAFDIINYVRQGET